MVEEPVLVSCYDVKAPIWESALTLRRECFWAAGWGAGHLHSYNPA